MYKTTLELEFLSDWHVGSGLGDGALADAILVRDVNGIPYIPGSAIKGALREGAWRMGLWDEFWRSALPDYFFGKTQTPDAPPTPNEPGVITVGSGCLPDDLQTWLTSQPVGIRNDVVGDMTLLRRQTRLDKTGQAVPHSLRAIECGIPGLKFRADFTAQIPPEAEAWFTRYLECVCASIKSMGADRARGLGTVRITFAGASTSTPVIPEDMPDILKSLIARRNCQ